MAWYNPFSWLQANGETFVLNLIAQVKADFAIAEADIVTAVNWLDEQAPTIAADVVALEDVVKALGVSNPTVDAGVAAANAAVAALNAMVAAQKNGSSTAAQVVAAYTTLKASIGATATAVSAVTQSGNAAAVSALASAPKASSIAS